MSCSADERAADGMEAMLTRKGESVEFGECKRWFWNNFLLFFRFSINVIADFERNYANPQCKTNVKKLYYIYSFYGLYSIIELINMNEFVEIKNKLIDYFSQKPEIDTVILFGSFAKETYNKNSDIDIAIHSTRKLNYKDLSSLQTDIALLCKREVDLADLEKAEGVFLYQIMTTGKRIKFSYTVFTRYLIKALCFKEDFLPTIEYSRKQKIRSFVNG